MSRIPGSRPKNPPYDPKKQTQSRRPGSVEISQNPGGGKTSIDKWYDERNNSFDPIDNTRLDPIFRSEQYPSINYHTYPNDLLSDDSIYGGNYVVFYINALEDSKLFDGSLAKDSINANATPRDFSNIDGKSVNGEGQLVPTNPISAKVYEESARVVGGLAVYGLGKAAGLNDVIAGIGGAGVGGILAGNVLIDKLGGAKQEYKRIDTAIALYIPNELNVRYSSQWEPASLDMGLAAVGVAQQLGAGKLVDAVGGVGADYLSSLALKTPLFGNLLSRASKTASNPKKEQLFREVDFRTFNFNYEFFPRNADEIRNVINIINQFKFHMHPEFRPDTNQFLFMYPSQFDISYYNKGVENPYLHKHVSCALTDVSINYTPSAVFAAFENGMPAHIKMVLTFKELSILTKERISEGF